MVRAPRLAAGVAVLVLALGGPAASALADPVIAAAGDIACAPDNPFFFGGDGDATHCAERRTANLIGTVDGVLPLGDEQYNSGSLANFNAVYANTWGAFKSQSHPVPGNHEYGTSAAGGYFSYFGAKAGIKGQGWYSDDVGAWHPIAINSECDRIRTACAAGGGEAEFVPNALAPHPPTCPAPDFPAPPCT